MCGTLTSFLTGSAASGASAATSGLFGTAGNFALGQTLSTVGTVAALVGKSKAVEESSKTETGIIKREADLIQRQGEFDVKQRKTEARKLKSRQIVTAAKSGVRRSGSVLDIMNEAADIAEEEIANIEFGAASGVQTKLFEAKQVKKAAKIDLASTALTSLTSFGRR